jgi:hypothetical protein
MEPMKSGVSYFSSRDIRHVRADLQEMADIGCTYVVHCYTETDLAFYRETMTEIASATHELGMEVWFDTWGLAGIFSGETFTRFPLDHPESWQVLSDGRRVGHGCPNHPATRAFIREWVDAAAAAGGDVIMWDEPHFYAGLFVRDLAPAWACYCEHCRALFRDRFDGDLPTEFTPEVKRFREDSLLDLLTELCCYGHEEGMRNALCPVPTDLEAHGFPEPGERLRQIVRSSAGDVPDSGVEGMLNIGIGDFARCAAIPDLDVFGTDPYWYIFGVDPERFMRTYSNAAAGACREHDRELQLWLQAFRVPAGREEELRMGVRIAEEVGANYLAAWSFRATESMSGIACKDPARVWQVLGEEFRRVSQLD